MLQFQDADSIIKICDIYDWDGKGVLDMYYFMDVFYALGFNITKKICDKYGQMDNIEKKYLKFDEVIKLVQQAVKEPEHSGEYKDYAELCKLYDKNDNGTIMYAELENFLSNMGKFDSSVNFIDNYIVEKHFLRKRKRPSRVKSAVFILLKL